MTREADVELGGCTVEIVSTRQVGAPEGLDYWNEIIGSTYRGMVVDAPRPLFEAQLAVWRLGQLRMVRPRSSPAVVRRHESRSTVGCDESIIAHIVNSGQVDLTQRGRRVSLTCGDMVLCAGEEYYRFDCNTEHQLTVVEFDAASLVATLPEVHDSIAVRISGQTPGSRIFQSFLSALWIEANQSMGQGMARVQAAVVVELLRACLADTAVSNFTAADPVLQRVRDVIADRIDEFALGPAMVASDAGIPLRTLQAAAARCGTTIGQMITEYRLTRGASMLRADPRKSVIDIALECGFSDPSYFARRFAQRFGMSPRSYRLAH
ncbi:MAG TPA: helix-turn-helix domain-containing protein [Novosphingobium sp.]|nr:helix-turn-helix domain-containing protein [Novosphingobium sp.]